MNNLAFGLRGPMLLGLTSVFGLHYVLANLISLCSLTVARFALADRWIWGTARETRALYDIHDLVTVDSDVVLPELARFRVPALDHPASIRVTVESLGEISRLGHGLSEDGDEVITYREGIPGGFAVRINKSATVSIAVSPLVRRSPHVLYTNCVEPVLRWHFAELGIALVHAACVSLDERAFLITARTDTGKTTTILRLLDALSAGRVHLRRPHARGPRRERRRLSEAAHDQPAHAARRADPEPHASRAPRPASCRRGCIRARGARSACCWPARAGRRGR